MGAGSSVRRDPTQKSNTELISSLRGHFAAHSGANAVNGTTNGDSKEAPKPVRANYKSWTHMADDGRRELEVPKLHHSSLQEEREAYDITVKLFYLPGAPVENRATQTREAVKLVLKELAAPSIDLLIISFPGIYFDEEEDCPDKISTRGPIESDPEPLHTQIETWKTLEALKREDVVKKLGIAEFGRDRLLAFLEQTSIKPSVDQINLRDCCSVPKPLLALAKSEGIDLLVHNDTSNILPRGTLRELLGPTEKGAGVLAEPTKAGEKRKSFHGEESQSTDAEAQGLRGEVQPLWVIKYTAVVKNRGVVENKGYFAVAELTE